MFLAVIADRIQLIESTWIGNMKQRAQSSFVLLLVVVLLAGCDRRKEIGRSSADAEMQRTIAGTWGVVISNVEGVIALQPGGDATGYWSNRGNIQRGWRWEGNWKIVDGALVTTITAKSAWNFPLSGPTNTVERVKILRLAGREMVASTEEQTNVWSRKR